VITNEHLKTLIEKLSQSNSEHFDRIERCLEKLQTQVANLEKQTDALKEKKLVEVYALQKQFFWSHVFTGQVRSQQGNIVLPFVDFDSADMLQAFTNLVVDEISVIVRNNSESRRSKAQKDLLSRYVSILDTSHCNLDVENIQSRDIPFLRRSKIHLSIVKLLICRRTLIFSNLYQVAKEKVSVLYENDAAEGNVQRNLKSPMMRFEDVWESFVNLIISSGGKVALKSQQDLLESHIFHGACLFFARCAIDLPDESMSWVKFKAEHMALYQRCCLRCEEDLKQYKEKLERERAALLVAEAEELEQNENQTERNESLGEYLPENILLSDDL
jgi:hypothetical protein